MFHESRFAAAAESVPKIAALSGVSAGSLLDLACGPGRFAVPFAQAGFLVTGVDRSKFLLEKARDLAARTATAVEWVEQDMREFLRPDSFDLAINLFTSFGYFDAAVDNRRVLENIHASLKPGGAFVFDHMGKEILAARYQPTQSEALPDGSLLIQRVSVIDGWSRVAGEWTFVAGSKATTFTNRHWLYSGQEIKTLLADVGFVDVRLYGSLEATPYGPQAQRLVPVAKKQAS
ncbi:MAG: class I SAM-dependent methyltransferase [Pirellulales bacterium]